MHVTNLIFNRQWSVDTSPVETKLLLNFIKRINHFAEIFKDPCILIHGTGGGSNCLLMCGLFVLVDQINCENSVDIFNVVKYLNTQRWNTKINYVSLIKTNRIVIWYSNL